MALLEGFAAASAISAMCCMAGWIVSRRRLTAAAAELEFFKKDLESSRKDRDALEKTSLVLAEERQVLELVAHGASLAEIFNTLTHAVERLAPGCMCSILLVDPKRGCLIQGAAPGLPAGYWGDVQGHPDCSGSGLLLFGCGQKRSDHRGRYCHRSTVGADPGNGAEFWIASLLERANPRAPARITSLGTFAMYHATAARPAELELRMVEAGAQLAGRAIERVLDRQNLVEQVDAKERAIAELRRRAGADDRSVAAGRHG